jgi:hypothetical protein
MVHAADPPAPRVVPDSFKNVVPSVHVRIALLPGVPVPVHVQAHVPSQVLNRSSGIRRNDPRCAAPKLSAKNWPTNREGFRPPR